LPVTSSEAEALGLPSSLLIALDAALGLPRSLFLAIRRLLLGVTRGCMLVGCDVPGDANAAADPCDGGVLVPSLVQGLLQLSLDS